MAVDPCITATGYVLIGTNVGPFGTIWPYEEPADVQVWLTVPPAAARMLTNGPDYSIVQTAPLATGGMVTLDASLPGAAWAADAGLILRRATSNDQPSSFGEALGFSPRASEAALDHLERQVQDVHTSVAVAGAGGQLIVLFGPNILFASVAAASAAAMTGDTPLVQTAGYYAAGDLGGARYHRAAAAPAHVGKFRSQDRFLPNGAIDAANGGWWELSEPVVNVNMLGAHGDAIRLIDGVVTAGSHTVTAASGRWTPADVGKVIEILGAAAAGAGLTSTIAGYNSPTSVEMADPAGSTAAGRQIWYGTDDEPHLHEALNYINLLGGGHLTLLPKHAYQMNLNGVANGSTRNTITGATGFTFDFAGGRLVALRDFSIGSPGAANLWYFLYLVNCTNTRILNGHCEFFPDATMDAFQYGVITVYARGALNTTFEMLQFGGNKGIWFIQQFGDDASVIGRGLHVSMRNQTTAYPLVIYETVDVTGTLTCDQPERALFAANTKNVHLTVHSSNAKAEDILVESEASDRRLTAATENVTINYYNGGRAATTAPGAMIQHLMRTGAGHGGARSMNVAFNCMANMDGAPGESVLVATARQIESAPDAYITDVGPARGHYVQGLKLSGVVTGMTPARALVQLFVGWPAGEHVNGLELDFVADGTGPISIDGAAVEDPMRYQVRAPGLTQDFTNWDADILEASLHAGFRAGAGVTFNDTGAITELTAP